jgi:hypothetical protein
MTTRGRLFENKAYRARPSPLTNITKSLTHIIQTGYNYPLTGIVFLSLFRRVFFANPANVSVKRKRGFNSARLQKNWANSKGFSIKWLRTY